jgi:NitT/TauT family transport system substrate-binding protein
MKGSVVKERPKDVQNIVLAWYDAIDWWRANPDKAVAIMAKRTGTSVADYKDFIMGTRILSAPESLAALTKSDKVTSLYVSGKANSDFLMQVKQIDKIPDFEAAIDPQFVKAAVDQGVGKLPPYDYSKKG